MKRIRESDPTRSSKYSKYNGIDQCREAAKLLKAGKLIQFEARGPGGAHCWAFAYDICFPYDGDFFPCSWKLVQCYYCKGIYKKNQGNFTTHLRTRHVAEAK